jgi:cytoskeleton protein RodZ
MHLWTPADRPLIGMRLFLAHQANSIGLGWRVLRTRLLGTVRELQQQRRRAKAQPNRRRAWFPRSEVRDDVIAVPALEAELDPVALPAAPFPSVGILLRETRETLGGDLLRISTVLRIRPDHLRAIELGNYGALPAPAYAIGFIRSYADLLGLDAAEMVRRFKQETGKQFHTPALAFPQPLRTRGVSLGGALVGLLVLALCAVGVWYQSHADRQNRDAIAAVPAPALVAPPSNAAAIKTADGPEAMLASLTPSAGPPALSQVSSEAATAHSIEVAQAQREAPPAKAASGTSTGQTQIVLRATAKTWLEVKDGGTTIFRKLLQPGDEYPVPDKPGLSLRLGNVHGIEVLADGKPLPSAAQPSQGQHAVVTIEARELMAKVLP